jgi:hypothetical protein
MATFANSKRSVYTKDKVRSMRTNRMLSKPKKKDIDQSFWDKKLGKLQAAGHLKLNGFSKLDIELRRDDGMFDNSKTIFKKHRIEFTTALQDGTYGDAPHLTGYLESASVADRHPYRIKGWFNEDGTIRLELVE